jgi:hypothetical protein
LLLLRRRCEAWVGFVLLLDLLVQMLVLLEPVAIHSVPFDFHSLDDLVQFALFHVDLSLFVQVVLSLRGLEGKDGFAIIPNVRNGLSQVVVIVLRRHKI